MNPVSAPPGRPAQEVLVSVVIPAYNAEGCLSRALDSVLAQTHAPVEILVVNDGSTDGTLRLLDRYAEQVKVINQANQGAGAARNAGIRASQGRYIAFLDADDRWLPTKLDRQIAALEGDPEAGLCYTNGAHYNETGVTQPSHAALRRPHSGWVFEPLFVENFMITSSVLVRRDSVEMVGEFNPQYLNAQDYDLWTRLARRYRFVYVDEILVQYWSMGKSLCTNYDRLYTTDFMISRRLMEDDPQFFENRPGLVRTRFGSLHFRYGWRLFRNGRFEEARREFGSSRRYRPMDIRTYGYWAATFLPEALIEGIRRFRRAMSLKAR